MEVDMGKRFTPDLAAAARKRQETLERLEAGIPGLHPHIFRHSMASWFLRSGGDVATLQVIGGWRNTQMAEHYSRSVWAESAIERARALNVPDRILPTGQRPVAGGADIEDRIRALLADPEKRARLELALRIIEGN
jgi:hypothetical protein